MAKLNRIEVLMAENGIMVVVKEAATKANPTGVSTYLAHTADEVLQRIKRRLSTAGYPEVKK